MIVFDGLPLCNAHRQRGIGFYVRGVLRSLSLASRQRAIAISVLTMPDPVFVSEFPSLKTWRPSWPNVRLGWLFSAALAPYDFRQAGNARLFHATDPNGMCKPARLPMLATAYDLTPLHFPAEYLDRFPPDAKAGYSQMLKRYRSAEHIVAISKHTRDDFIDKLGIPAERITVIYPGIDIDEVKQRFSPQASPSVPECPSLFFLYVGAIEPRKNVDAMLKAFASVANEIEEDFLLAGYLSAAQVEQTHALAAKLGIAHRVRLMGMVSNEVLGQLYARATALVFVSKLEGFGLPVLEAMAVGCPVICSDAAALGEIAPGAARIVSVDDTHGLSKALTDLSTDSQARALLIEQGHARAATFSLQSAGQDFHDLYRALL
jgi:glycosyltransferase involved in cell wall biosynthesis